MSTKHNHNYAKRIKMTTTTLHNDYNIATKWLPKKLWNDCLKQKSYRCTSPGLLKLLSIFRNSSNPMAPLSFFHLSKQGTLDDDTTHIEMELFSNLPIEFFSSFLIPPSIWPVLHLFPCISHAPSAMSRVLTNIHIIVPIDQVQWKLGIFFSRTWTNLSFLTSMFSSVFSQHFWSPCLINYVPSTKILFMTDLNFSTKLGCYNFHFNMLTSNILGTKLRKASSKAFLPLDSPSMPPLTFTLNMGDFCPPECFKSTFVSASFLAAFLVALALLSLALL